MKLCLLLLGIHNSPVVFNIFNIAQPVDSNGAQRIIQQYNLPTGQPAQVHDHVALSERIAPMQQSFPLPLTLQPSLSGAVVPGTPYIVLHPPIKSLPPDLANIENKLQKVIYHFEDNCGQTLECFKESGIPISNVCTYLTLRKHSFLHEKKVQQKVIYVEHLRR